MSLVDYPIIYEDIVSYWRVLYNPGIDLTVTLIAALDMCKSSPFFGAEIKKISQELYEYILFIGRDARIISIQGNTMYLNRNIEPEGRGRKDNTTRLQIIYGYNNYDVYILRLDMAHKGEVFTHLNNKSPGSLKCCLFTKAEYLNIIDKYPELESCFIEYNERWALKERGNCNPTDKFKEIYENIRCKKEHEPILQDFSEGAIEVFLQDIMKILPSRCYVEIDKEEVHSNLCFDFNKVMLYSTVYMMGIFLILKGETSPEETDSMTKLRNLILNVAMRNNLIQCTELKEFNSTSGICRIIDLFFEKLNLSNKEDYIG